MILYGAVGCILKTSNWRNENLSSDQEDSDRQSEESCLETD
jgi:hypothetical protein